jgi:TolA-binding protein
VTSTTPRRNFAKLGKQDLIVSMLERLAAMLLRAGQVRAVHPHYRRLITKYPNSKRAPHFQNEIACSRTRQMEKKGETIEESERPPEDLRKNSAWARANAASPETVTERRGLSSRRTCAPSRSTTTTERRSCKSGPAAKEAYAHRLQGVQHLPRNVPTSKYSYDVRYRLGELLYKVKRYDVSGTSST